jgi:hypothetical protein
LAPIRRRLVRLAPPNTANVAIQKAKKKPVKRAQAKLTAAVAAEEE